MTTASPDVGDVVDLEVGPVAHGGHCVAALDGKVVFVRHTIPGERVRARITESGKRFDRADTVTVLRASPDRVTPPCELAGICGGCDFQHVDVAAQRRMLGAVVREQFRRLAGVERDVEVEPVGDDGVPHARAGLDWRTRIRWAVDDDGRLGLRRHRSHTVVPVDECPISHPELPDPGAGPWSSPVAVVRSSTGERAVMTGTGPAGADDARGRGGRSAPESAIAIDGPPAPEVARDAHIVRERVRGRTFVVEAGGFWQVHPHAAPLLVDAVVEGAQLHPDDRVFDLYGGAGLFSAFILDHLGPDGSLVLVENEPGAVARARENLDDPRAAAIRGRVERVLAPSPGSSGRSRTRHHDLAAADRSADIVVLDPPRTGAKPAVEAIAVLGARRIVYVSCDPASLARDVAMFAQRGYEVAALRAFDVFPMTHHVECVAVLEAANSGPSDPRSL